MGLDIGILGAIDLADAVDGKLLDLVDDLAPAVISLAGVAFSIFVGADGAHGFHNIVAHVILRGDELEAGGLPVPFLADQVKNLKILFHINQYMFRASKIMINILFYYLCIYEGQKIVEHRTPPRQR